MSNKKQIKYVSQELGKFRARLINDYDFKNDTSAMNKDAWLVAYEADKNKWLNTSGTDVFTFARNKPFFKDIYELDIDFYDSKYEYENISDGDYQNNIFVTRKELDSILKEFKNHFLGKDDESTIVETNYNLFETIFKKITIDSMYSEY